jgi:microcompartment protein CcmL/EutN
MEFASIARGVETTDKMLKAAQVRLIKTSTVCPGKYITVLTGQVESVAAALETGRRHGGEYVVDTLEIPSAHAQLIPAIAGGEVPARAEALGGMEFYSVTAGISAADIAVKAANVNLIEIKIGYAIGGKGVVILSGDLEAVKTSIRAAETGTCADLYMQSSVIARPDAGLFESLL